MRRIFIVLAATVVLAVAAVVAIVWLASPASVSTSAVSVEEDHDFGTVEVYAVLDDGSLDPAATGLTAEVWETFTRVTTLDFAAEVMTQYRAGDAADSDTLAYVYQDEDPIYWVLAANLATSADHEQLVATLIHEYAHILSLSTDELDPDATSCPGLRLDEGCAGEGSALLGFQRAFWDRYGDSAPALDNVDADVAWEFYLEHEEDFVSDYAATNLVEDFAESFMTFVLEDEPSGDTVVAAKLRYFWDVPEFVAIRERIRAEFADDLGLVG